MAPLRGPGDRVARAPFGPWIDCHRRPALRPNRRAAGGDGPVNGGVCPCAEKVPVPPPGRGVVMDSLGSHKSLAVRRAIRNAGAELLFPPPYSPELNPSGRPSPDSETGAPTIPRHPRTRRRRNPRPHLPVRMRLSRPMPPLYATAAFRRMTRPIARPFSDRPGPEGVRSLRGFWFIVSTGSGGSMDGTLRSSRASGGRD